MKLHPLLRYVWWIWAGPLTVGSVLAAESPPAPPEVLTLPKLIVTNTHQLPPPESWRYTQIPGVEVLSNASNSSTQRFLKDFQLLQQVIDVTWPGMRAAAVPLPTTFIIYERGEGASDFLKPKGTLVGDEVIEFQPVDRDDPDYAARPGRLASRFLSDDETACIVVDLQLGSTGLTDPYRQFYGEYVRYLVSRLEVPAPPWLVEGVVRLYSGVDFTTKWINFAQVGDGRGGPRTGDFNTVLGRPPVRNATAAPLTVRDRSFPSLAQMLQADRVALLVDRRLSALSHAFVHMCLYGRGQRYQKPLFDYLERVKGGAGTPAQFEECFGMSIKSMEQEIQGYVSFTDHKLIQLKAKKDGGLVIPSPAVLREATQAEVGRIKGQGLMLARNRDAARLEFIAPYVRGKHDADLLAALGLYELGVRHTDRGRRFLENAAAGHTTRAKAYAELARLRFASPAATPGEPQREMVLAPLRAAAGLPPPLVGVYELMAKIWTEGPGQPPAGDLAILENGVRRFPGNLGLVYQTARLHSQAGLTQKAEGMADWGQRASRDAADKERFAQLRASLPVTTPSGVK